MTVKDELHKYAQICLNKAIDYLQKSSYEQAKTCIELAFYFKEASIQWNEK